MNSQEGVDSSRREKDRARKVLASKYALAVNNLLVKICGDQGIEINISRRILAEVSLNYVKEIEKIQFHQGDDISSTKRIVALAFWIRRLKPIYFAHTKTKGEEIPDVNEQAAIWLATTILVDNQKDEYMPRHFRELNLGDKWEEFRKYICCYWKMAGHANFWSLTYAMRHRNISPHHLALYLDAVISGFTLRHTHIS